MSSVLRAVLCGTALATIVCLGAAPASAQDLTDPARRAMATRAELEATIREIDKIVASTGYSGDLRNAKQLEAAAIRERLVSGDFQVGDQLVISSGTEQKLNGTFTVAAGRVLVLPDIPPIPLEGVLRSEAQEYVEKQVMRYIRDPQLRVQSMIRLALFGSIGKPGFYQLPADQLLTDAIMSAGGPSALSDFKKSYVKRGDEKIITPDMLQDAILNGVTLDRLNLRAGDEIYIDSKTPGGFAGNLRILGALAGVMASIY
ncbi:MAG: polysaccharide biosynthesis/export family protein, partial [Gemmatimonadota bacterium]